MYLPTSAMLFGLLLASLTGATAAHANAKCECDASREKAIAINNAISSTFDRFDTEPVQSVNDFVSFFAPDGFFQVVGLPASRGVEAIRASFLAYTADPGEKDQHVISRKYYWDEKTATLTEERTWFATLTKPKNFCGTILPENTTYSQDDAIIVRFACDSSSKKNCMTPGKVVYYHEYFDQCQFQSNFTDDYPSPCSSGKPNKGATKR